jgi:hypothetical protein
MLSKKQLLRTCLSSDICVQVLCFLLTYYFLNDYFLKYVAYSIMGIVIMFLIIRFLVAAPVPWSIEKYVLFSSGTRRYLLFFASGLAVLSLLAKLIGSHLPLEYVLPIEIGTYLAEYSLILAAEKKGE